MTEPATTPFIPPLNTPAPSPNAAAQPPLVPQPPTGANPQYPSWAAQPQGAGSYPIYPNTPYTAGGATPFLPFQTPQPGMPQYFPGTGPPPAAMQLPPDFGHGGGYPGFGGPTAPPWAAAAYPGTPWAGGAPPGTPWAGGAPPGTPWSHGAPSPYAPVGHPMAAFGAQPQPPPQLRPAAWGGGAGAGAFTPGPDPWGAQPHGAAPPPWAQAQMAQMGMGMGGMPGGMPGMGGGMPGMGGGMPGMMTGMGGAGLGFGFGGAGAGAFGMMEQQQPLSRAIGQVGDRVGQFEAGPHYGPVLEPFLIRAVHAKVRLNPLIQPTPDSAGAPPPYLKWNMLFPSNQCQRSDEAVHMSWSNGRHEPATFPRVTLLQLVSETFPWVVKITARNRDIGVTCGEVVDYISRDMYRLTGQAEYEALPSGRKRIVGEAYRHNRSRANGVPGGQLNPGMLRLDWLGAGHDVWWGKGERAAREACVWGCVAMHV
ncbi:hypothetical protein MVEN_01067900 [Mycena venus]|uniref:DUF6699 domain-containing protein n=1 Tax=Mycena venus TaxID=2733690 RepID=A0A8H6Y441_9AGAR|nr:hypothetical protein MVEN_01067900 [Mycena venus]